MQRERPILHWIAALVSVGGILYGYDMGVISGALLFIRNAIPMTDTQMGYIVGAVLGGCLLGTLLAGPIGDRFGRRALILILTSIFMVGITQIVLAQSFIVMFLARLLLGVGVGMVAVAVPLYVAEIVPANHRGKYITFFQLLLTFGILLAYLVDLIFTPSGNWRAMFAILYVPTLILFCGMLFLPESPRWLCSKGRSEEARAVLRQVRKSEKEVDDDMRLIESPQHTTRGRYRELFAKPSLFACLIAVSVAIFNQLTGINAILQYAPLILKQAGIHSNQLSMLGSAGVGLLNFIFTLVAVTLIDRVGRRPLLLTGIAGVLIAEVYLAAVNFFLLNSPLAGFLSLLGLFLFIVSFAIGPGVVVWLAISELFSTRVRGKGMSLCLFASSIAATGLSVYFLPLMHSLGVSGLYTVFAFSTCLYGIVAWRYLPETKARTLEEIQASLQERKKLMRAQEASLS